MPLPPKIRDGAVYDPAFLRDLSTYVAKQRDYAEQIGNLPVAQVFAHAANAIDLYADDLSNPNNQFVGPSKDETDKRV